MSLDACAGLVARGDAERFRALMAAPVAARGKLLPLYAFNLELARAPWVAKEPMIAEMRLQWWRDIVAEPMARAHEVAGPLHELIQNAALPIELFDRMAEARRWDIYREPFADQAAFEAYIEDTAAGLMWLSALALGTPDSAEAAVRDFGYAAGLASFLRAVPELESRGRVPLVDGRPAAVADLAMRGLMRLHRARGQVPAVARPALLAGWQAAGLLEQAAKQPHRVADGALGLAEFTSRGKLLLQAWTGWF